MRRIAISNLAWRKSEDEQVFDVMRNLGVFNLEISPFRDAITVSEVKKQFSDTVLKKLNHYGIDIVACQALMFRYPEVSLFKDEVARNGIFAHLISVLEFSNQVGAKVVVFGSPKNKIKAKLSHHEAMSVAKDFFEKLAERAKAFDVTFCIESTPSAYGADFICNTQEAVDFVRAVGHRSLKVNLDIGSSILNNEKIDEIVTDNIKYIGHIHVSTPHLKAINPDHSFHKNIAKALNSNNYNGIVSIEMLPTNQQNTKNISETISFIKEIYQ